MRAFLTNLWSLAPTTALLAATAFAGGAASAGGASRPQPPFEAWAGPAAVGAGAAGSRYATTVVLGDGPAAAGTTGTLEYHARGAVAARETFTIPPGGTLRREAPEALSGAGPFSVRVVAKAPLALFTETANVTPAGRYGVAVPSFAPEETLSAGDVATFRGAAASADPLSARANAGLLCLPGAFCRAEVVVAGAGGEELGRGLLEVPSSGAKQESLAALVPAAAGRDRLSVSVVAHAGRFRPYVVGNDNGTSDGVLLPHAVDRTHGSTFAFPIGCRLGSDCWVSNYLDRDDGPGTRDYAGGAVAYDGHDGVDVLVNGFAAMEQGVAVHAAAEGEVLGVEDGADDRCVTGDCPTENGVLIGHADGTATYYAHLRKGSILVAPGERVARGQRIAEVGSSGRSTDAHLHFSWLALEPLRILDPFVRPEDGLVTPWEAPPAYQGYDGARVARIVLSRSGAELPSWSLDPPAGTFAAGGVAFAHVYGVRLAEGAVLSAVLRDPSGREISRQAAEFPEDLSYASVAVPLLLDGPAGTYTLEILEGTRLLAKRAFTAE